MSDRLKNRFAFRNSFAMRGLSLVVASAALITSSLTACGEHDGFPEKPVRPTIAAPAPITLGARQAEANRVAAKPDVIDLRALPGAKPELVAILAALQTKDDQWLAAVQDADELFCPPLHCMGNAQEPPPEITELIGQLAEHVHTYPVIAAHLGAFAERQKDEERAALWYATGYAYGSTQAEEHLVALAKRNSTHLETLLTAYAGEFDDAPSRDAAKAAQILRLALSSATDAAARQRLSSVADKLVKRNGPDVAASAWLLLLPDDQVGSTATSITEALKTCLDKGGNPDLDSGANASDEPGNARLEQQACALALKSDPTHVRAWENIGWALEKLNKPLRAGIAYARAAELGSASAIAAYWRVRAPGTVQQSINALQAEAAAGNPWADLVLAQFYSGEVVAQMKDSKLRETHLRTAAAKGIPSAQNYLGLAFLDRKEFGEAEDWFRKAAYAGHVVAMFNLGWMAEHGRGGNKNLDAALRWYRRAASFGFKDAELKIAELSAPKPPIKADATPVEQATLALAKQASGPYIPMGAVVCESSMSFFKVNAIERSGNPYVQFPDDCAVLPGDTPVKIIRHLDHAVFVSTGAVTFYVRRPDLR